MEWSIILDISYSSRGKYFESGLILNGDLNGLTGVIWLFSKRAEVHQANSVKGWGNGGSTLWILVDNSNYDFRAIFNNLFTNPPRFIVIDVATHTLLYLIWKMASNRDRLGELRVGFINEGASQQYDSRGSSRQNNSYQNNYEMDNRSNNGFGSQVLLF